MLFFKHMSTRARSSLSNFGSFVVCLFVNNINNAFIVSEEKYSPVFQLVRPNAEASDSGKKLKKANTVSCP